MSGLIPFAYPMFFDRNGNPLAGGKVTNYTPGTSTLVNTYSDPDLTNVNANPITLDGSGVSTNQMWGDGRFRQRVEAADGTLIWDGVTSTYPIDFEVSDAMKDFLKSATLNNALTLLGESGDFDLTAGELSVPNNDIKTGKAFRGPALEINPGGQQLTVQPTANTADTLASLNVQGKALSSTSREFLANIGLESDIGSGQGDKVALYVGANGKDGTGNLWGLNTCVTATASSGDYILQSYECDTNNFNKARGMSGNIVADFSASGYPIYGIQVTGIGTAPCTSGIVVTGATANSDGTTPQWARGISFVGYIGKNAIHDASVCESAIKLDGTYSHAAIDFTSQYNNAGGTAAGGAMFMKNGMQINWQSNDKSKVIADYVENHDVRVIGQNADRIAAAAPLTPASNKVTNFGHPDFVWGNTYTLDMYPGEDAKFDLGADVLQWNNAYVVNGIVTTSDIRLKDEVTKLPSMKDVIQAVNPISFKWKKDGTETHLGFAAGEIQSALDSAGLTSGAYVKGDDGVERIRPHQLVPILWAAVKELMDEVKSLSAKLATA